MQIERGNSRKFALNTLYSVLSWLTPLLIALVTTPLLVRGLGVDGYGIYALVLGAVSYFLTYGVGKSAAKFVAEYKSKNDEAMVQKVVSASLVVNLAISLFASIVIALLSRTFVTSILDVDSPQDKVAETAILLACVTVVIAVPGQIFQFVLQGIHRFDRYLLIVNTNAALLAIGNIAIAIYFPSVVALFVWNLVMTASISLGSFIIAKREMPELRFDPAIGGEPIRAVAKYSFSIIGYQIFGNGFMLFERSLIMRNFGAESVTHYVVPMNLAMFIHIFCSSLVMALFPMLNEMLNDPTRLRKVYEVVTKVIMCVAAFSALSAFAIGERFLQVWIGIDFAQAAHRVLLVHIVAFSLLALVTVAWQVAESFRAASMNSIATIIWTIAAVPFMILLSDRIGFEGVAFGRAVGVLAYVVLMILVERKFIERSSENFWIRSLLRVVIAAVAAVGVEFLLVEQLGITWLAVIVSLIAGAVTFAAAIVLLRLFDENERSMFLRAIGR